MKNKQKIVTFYLFFILAGVSLLGNFAEAQTTTSCESAGGTCEIDPGDPTGTGQNPCPEGKEKSSESCDKYNWICCKAKSVPPSCCESLCKAPEGGKCLDGSVPVKKSCSEIQSCSSSCCEKLCKAPEGGKCLDGSVPVKKSCSEIQSCSSSTTTTGCCVNGIICTNAKVASDCQSPATFESKKCSEIQSCSSSCCEKLCKPPEGGKCLDGSVPVEKSCSEIQSCSSSGGTTTTSTTFTNPIAYEKISEVLDALLNNLMGIIAFIAVIFIIIGGIMYMIAAGDETMVTRAKKTWTGAVTGFAIALASPTFLKEIKKILGGGGTGGSVESWVDSALTINEIAINVLELLLSVIGIVAIISLVIGGGTYLTAYGDEKRLDSAKKIVKFSIIGITVALASLIIVKQIARLFGMNV